MDFCKKGKVKLDEGKVSDFVASIRRKYDTIFRPRKFKTSYGETITIDSGDYGWWMNTSQEIKRINKPYKKRKTGKENTFLFPDSCKLWKK